MSSFIGMDLPIPADLLFLWQVIHDAGHDVLFVGGCVRDLIIGETVHDYDLTTSATPSEIMALFPCCIPTGIQHGTVTVLHQGHAVEVTTFRTEDGYLDGRRPDKVSFVGCVDGDLKRRDFTCNSLAYRPDRGLLDLFDGLVDLNSHCLRTVGSASARFSEDALRMLRAVRFCSQLDLEPEQSLLQAAQLNQERIYKLSRERIAAEFSRLFSTRFPQRLSAFAGIGIIQTAADAICLRIAKEEDTIHLLQQLLPGQTNAANLPPELIIPTGLLAILLTGQTGNDASDVLQPAQQQAFIRNLRIKLIREARFSSAVASHTAALFMAYASIIGITEFPAAIRVRIAAARIHSACLLEPDEARFLVVKTSLILCLMQEAKQPLCWPGLTALPTSSRKILDAAMKMQRLRDVIAINELPVSGEDLIRLGVPPGRQIGHILDQLLRQVILSPEPLNRECLLALAAEHFGSCFDN